MQQFFIINAINGIYPDAVSKVCNKGAEEQRPAMPQLDVLPCIHSEHVTMGAILEDEATISGNYRVLQNIFLDQLGLDEKAAFEECLYLYTVTGRRAVLSISARDRGWRARRHTTDSSGL